ncbi:MAG: glutaminyl-peptide cyclotransferase [Bacteroidales bacterium]|nr:glutaminyl-peptide cyclotransferase [Bacteroidales bacterium]
MNRFFHTVIIGLIMTAGTVTSCAQSTKVQNYTYKVLETYTHDTSAYTQGLFFDGDNFYETTGQYGESSLRRVDLKSGRVLQREVFDPKYFVEGSCVIGDRLYVLTWLENVCFVYDKNTFKKIGQFTTRREGWGLTTDGKYLIQSDGSAQIYFIDPATFVNQRSITVRLNGKTQTLLNELEYIDGKIWANVYTEDIVVIINPDTGNVEGVVDFSNILPKNLRTSRTDVLNGIAYEPESGSLYVTGKYWPRLYKVEIVPVK